MTSDHRQAGGARQVTVAAVQCRLGGARRDNVGRVERLVREAASRGAQIVLPPELFEGPYFPREERAEAFDAAAPAEGHPTLERFAAVARELEIVIPVSFFERDRTEHFNSVAILDADGTNLGVYRKSHIPDGPGYEEKFYFRPGNTGFRVWHTRYATIGVGICWDQWFPECARAMTLQGAELLLYPTATGSEPHQPDLHTREPGQRVMVGHAVANVIPIVAANRIGTEGELTFYGASFVANERGDKLAELGREDEGCIQASFDLDTLRRQRAEWGFFRDRRPELYGALVGRD